MKNITLALTEDEAKALFGLLDWYCSQKNFIKNQFMPGNWVAQALVSTTDKLIKLTEEK